MNNKERFLEELHGEYDKQFELKERIEGKAGSLLTICGITIPLLFGFSSFLIEKIDKSYYFMHVITLLITIGIFATIISIFFILFVFKTRTYFHAITPDKFLIFNKDNEADMTEINNLVSKDEDEYLNNRILNHLYYIKKNGENNVSKAKLLKRALWVFAMGMTTIPITVGILLFNLPNVQS